MLCKATTAPSDKTENSTRLAAITLLSTHAQHGAKNAVSALLVALTIPGGDYNVRRASLAGLFAVADPKDVSTTASLGLTRVLKGLSLDIAQDVAVICPNLEPKPGCRGDVPKPRA
jgi:hypothetical protein